MESIKQKAAHNGTSNGLTNGKLPGKYRGANSESVSNGNSNGFSEVTEITEHHSSVVTAKDERFLRDVFEVMMQNGLKESYSYDGKVMEFQHPEELKTKVDIALKDHKVDDSELLELCRQTVKYSVKTGHPYFYNQLLQGFDVYSTAGAWLTETLNTSQYTYEVSPLFTLIEQEVVRKTLELLGFTNGDGIFCPGGSISNFYGINVARFAKFPEIKTKGMHGLPKICVFTSEQCHYSLTKGVAFCGIGTDNLIKVKCDALGRMIPSELESAIVRQIQEGCTPLMVNATAGSTVLGAYDPLEPIADICQKYDLWLHVDGAWGGSCILSRKHRNLVKGINRANSVTWDPHKMVGAHMQCVIFLVNDETILKKCHSANASYLFQQDKFYDVSYDTGDKSIQCGRKVDAFKLWLMWKARGNTGLEAEVDNAYDCAEYLTDLCRNREGFRLVLDEPECTNVCFWYIPPSLRGQVENQAWWTRVSKVAPEIKKRMMVEGTLLVGYQPLGDKVNFFRMVVSTTKSSREDMVYVLDEIHRLGEDL